MMSRNQRRLEDVSRAIGSRPIPVALARAAFEHFKATGELPDDQRVAATVAQRVKLGFEAAANPTPEFYRGIVRDVMQNGRRPDDPYRDALIAEAIWCGGEVGRAARVILVSLVHHGHNVTDPIFVGCKVPEIGSVAMELLGFDRLVAQPPYEAQAARLFARIGKLRPRLPKESGWSHRMLEAVNAFQIDGNRPDDALVLEWALVLGELSTLWDHVLGLDVAEELAVFDAIGLATGHAREAAIERLQAMARAGRLAMCEATDDDR